MKYKGFFVKITPDRNLSREDKNGEIVSCDGFTIEVFSDESESLEIGGVANQLKEGRGLFQKKILIKEAITVS